MDNLALILELNSELKKLKSMESIKLFLVSMIEILCNENNESINIKCMKHLIFKLLCNLISNVDSVVFSNMLDSVRSNDKSNDKELQMIGSFKGGNLSLFNMPNDLLAKSMSYLDFKSHLRCQLGMFFVLG